MKKNMKNYVALACLSLGLLAGATGVAKIETKAAESVMTMEVGAGAYLDTVSGIRFNYTIAGYDKETFASRNFGMLIVPYDYLAKAGIDLTDDVADDYVTVLQAAAENYDAQTGTGIPNAPIVAKNLTPTDSGKVAYSIGGILEQNYTREFFGIGFEETASGYVYATLNNNVRSVFEVSNLALNKLHYGEWTEDEEDQAEKINLENNETTLNTFITEGLKFVYGTATPEVSFAATYVGGETTATVTETKIKEIDLKTHWVTSDTSGLTRGKGQAVTGAIGEAVVANGTVDVLKDETELQIYNDSKNVNFFGVADSSFAASKVADGTAYSLAKFDGGYWNGAGSSDGYKNPGYMVIKNPDDADGKYTLNTTGLTLDFYFTGNNMPNVQFFATDLENIDFGKSGGGTTGYMVTNGVARANTYYQYKTVIEPSYNSETQTYDTTDWLVNDDYRYNGIVGTANFFRFGVSANGAFNRGKYNSAYSSYFASSYALDDTNKSSGYNVISNPEGDTDDTWSEGALAYGTKLSMFELMKDETKNWHYQVCLYTSSSKPRWSARIYEVGADGTETLYHSKAAKLVVNTTVSGVSGYVVVHGALKGSKSYCEDAGNENYYYTDLAYKMPRASKFTS